MISRLLVFGKCFACDVAHHTGFQKILKQQELTIISVFKSNTAIVKFCCLTS